MTAGLLATDPLALGPYRLLGRPGGTCLGYITIDGAAGEVTIS